MPTAPGVPELLSVTATAPGTLTVAWRDNSNNEIGFELQRRKGSNGDWSVVAVESDATTYTDRGLAAGQRYDYRVRAVNAQGIGTWSNTMSGTPASAPAPPPPPPTPTPIPPPPTGAARYAAPGGSSSGQGTLASPWDIVTAMQSGRVMPGETLYLRGGTYPTARYGSLGLEVAMAGASGHPIHIKPYPGEHVIIDGGLRLVAPTQDLWIWELEVLVSAPRVPANQATVDDSNRIWGGINLDAGPRCKLINCIARDCCQGISAWKGATDLEVYGCLIYDNGWPLIDVNGNLNSSGYAIYAQNETGWKTISDCLFLDTYAWSFHIYGEASATDNFLVQGNVIALPARTDICLFGGMKPVKNLRVLGNWFFNSKTWIGYNFSEGNVNCEVRDNLSVDGYFKIKPNWQSVQQSGNVAVDDAAALGGPRVMLRPNKFDANRANLAVIGTGGTVAVDAGTFLKTGERYRLLNPRAMWGSPVLAGTYGGGTLAVPVSGGFAAYVLLKGG